MTANCEKHPFEFSEGLCTTCGHDFCGECLVFVKGPSKPPMCIACALTAAGVRSSAAPVAKYSRKELRRRRREQRKALRGAGETPDLEPDGEAIDGLPPLPLDPDPVPASEPAASGWRENSPTWTPTAFTPGS